MLPHCVEADRLQAERLRGDTLALRFPLSVEPFGKRGIVGAQGRQRPGRLDRELVAQLAVD